MVIGSCTPNNLAEWVVEVGSCEGAGCVGGGNGVRVDVGKGVGVFGIACLERTDGELYVTGKVYIFFGDLPVGIAGVVWGVAGGGETIVVLVLGGVVDVVVASYNATLDVTVVVSGFAAIVVSDGLIAVGAVVGVD